MAKASVETLLQPTEIREPMEPTVGNHSQPVSSRAKLGLTSSHSLAEPMSISFLGTEFPMGAATPHCCGLKRTFACTDLLLLSLAEDEKADNAEEDDDADRKAPPGPPIHQLSSMGTTKPATPLVSDCWGCPTSLGSPDTY
ncbi:testis-specific serine kinase substrate isoform 2-T2 [Ara ararauna]